MRSTSPWRAVIAAAAGALVACGYESPPSAGEHRASGEDCEDCLVIIDPSQPPALSLNRDHVECGLTTEDVRRPGFVAVRVVDPQAESKLACLASRGEHEILGQFSHELFWSDAHPTATEAERHARSYHWGMVALRNWLASLKIDLDDPQFFEAYRKESDKPGVVNPAGPSDNIYYYSDIPIAVLDTGHVEPSAAERRVLETIKRNRPTNR